MYPLGIWFVWGIRVWVPCVKETVVVVVVVVVVMMMMMMMMIIVLIIIIINIEQKFSATQVA